MTGDRHHESFSEGDRVRHEGEGIEGVVASTDWQPPHFRVEWDDGFETLESFHTVEFIGEVDA